MFQAFLSVKLKIMPKFRKHILLVAFPAFGHIIPLAELGKKLAQHHTVTFAVSAFMVDKIRQREVMKEKEISLIAIDDNNYVPDEAVTQPALLNLLSIIVPAARNLFVEMPARDRTSPGLTISNPVDAVICDDMLAGAIDACHRRGIPCHFFEPASVSMTLASLTVHEDTPVISTEGQGGMFLELSEPGQKSVPLSAFQKAMFLPTNQMMPLVSGIVANSVRELDREFLERIEEFPIMKNIPIRFIGPLMPSDEKVSLTNLDLEKKTKTWLDRLPIQSLVYVSYGSVAAPPAGQIPDLIKALLQLKKPFILTCPDSHDQHLPEELAAKIPTQFESGQFLVLPWSPQKLILQHPATAVFLSHCGWNSTLESIFSAVPVVGWPMFAEQKINAQLLVKLGIAVMLEGTGMRSELVIPAKEIVDAVKKVGGFDEYSGKNSYAQNVRKWKEIVSHGSSESELQDLIETI